MSTRGEHLVRARPRFRDRRRADCAARPRRRFAKVLDQIDRRLDCGGIEATLPDGRERRLGFRAPGPEGGRAAVELARAGPARDLGLGRLVQGVGARRMVEPRPGRRCSSCSRATPRRSARSAAPRARSAGSTRSPTGCATTRRARRGSNIAAHYDLGNDFYSAWLDATMTYSSARFASPDDSLEAAQLRKIRHAARPARPQARPAPARDRLRLGDARDRGGEARRDGRRPDPCRPSRRPGPSSRSPRPASPTGSRSGSRTIATPPSSSTRSPRSRWSRRSASAGGRAYLDSIARNLKPGGRAALQFISIDHRSVRPLCRATPTSSRPTSSPAGMLLDEPRFAALGERARPVLAGPRRLRPRLCRDAEALARALRRRRSRAARSRGFDEPFHDLWRYYLMYCEGGFRGGAIDVAQVTMVKR